MNKEILLINDMAGYGKVALSVMIPILSNMGINIYNLPTALVSNTLDYGKFDILDTTSYMENTLKVWKELGFSFKAISTGFIVSDKQAELISEYCKAQDDDVLIFCDPIMGDNGHLYNGMNEDTVKNMRKLVKNAHYVIPNITEACYLTDTQYKDNFTKDEIVTIINKLRELGAKSVVLTSVNMYDKSFVSIYDHLKNEYYDIEYTSLPVRFPGTGDIFSSILIGNVMNDKTLYESCEKAMINTKKLMELSINNKDKYNGIQVESYLEEIK